MILKFPLVWFYTPDNFINFLEWYFNFNSSYSNLKTLAIRSQLKNRFCCLFWCSFSPSNVLIALYSFWISSHRIFRFSSSLMRLSLVNSFWINSFTTSLSAMRLTKDMYFRSISLLRYDKRWSFPYNKRFAALQTVQSQV